MEINALWQSIAARVVFGANSTLRSTMCFLFCVVHSIRGPDQSPFRVTGTRLQRLLALQAETPWRLQPSSMWQLSPGDSTLRSASAMATKIAQPTISAALPKISLRFLAAGAAASSERTTLRNRSGDTHPSSGAETLRVEHHQAR